MMISYQYPVVYFHGDDPEDSEVIQREGYIEPLRIQREQTGTWDANCLIWMMFSGTMSQFLEKTNPSATKMPLLSRMR